jgi:hypothetical protein
MVNSGTEARTAPGGRVQDAGRGPHTGTINSWTLNLRRASAPH